MLGQLVLGPAFQSPETSVRSEHPSPVRQVEPEHWLLAAGHARMLLHLEQR